MTNFQVWKMFLFFNTKISRKHAYSAFAFIMFRCMANVQVSYIWSVVFFSRHCSFHWLPSVVDGSFPTAIKLCTFSSSNIGPQSVKQYTPRCKFLEWEHVSKQTMQYWLSIWPSEMVILNQATHAGKLQGPLSDSHVSASGSTDVTLPCRVLVVRTTKQTTNLQKEQAHKLQEKRKYIREVVLFSSISPTRLD